MPLSFIFLAILVTCQHLRDVNVEGKNGFSCYKERQLGQDARKVSDLIFKAIEQTSSVVVIVNVFLLCVLV